MRLEGKIVLVTGGVRGPGACDAAWIARASGTVIVTDVIDGSAAAADRASPYPRSPSRARRITAVG